LPQGVCLTQLTRTLERKKNINKIRPVVCNKCHTNKNSKTPVSKTFHYYGTQILKALINGSHRNHLAEEDIRA
jgi:hypothetical protein